MPHIVFKGNVGDLKFSKFKYSGEGFSFQIKDLYRGKFHLTVLLEVVLDDNRTFVVEVRNKGEGVIIKVGSHFFIERDWKVKKTLWEIYKVISGKDLIRTNIEEKFRDG